MKHFGNEAGTDRQCAEVLTPVGETVCRHIASMRVQLADQGMPQEEIDHILRTAFARDFAGAAAGARDPMAELDKASGYLREALYRRAYREGATFVLPLPRQGGFWRAMSPFKIGRA